MRTLRTLTLSVCAAFAMSGAAFAAPADYRFELSGPPKMVGKSAQVTVRLIHVPDGKAVADAAITDVKFDMGPAGMAGMSAPAKPMMAMDPGTYMIEAQPSMAGNWGLTLTAKVKGESEPVRGMVTVPVPK